MVKGTRVLRVFWWLLLLVKLNTSLCAGEAAERMSPTRLWCWALRATLTQVLEVDEQKAIAQRKFMV